MSSAIESTHFEEFSTTRECDICRLESNSFLVCKKFARTDDGNLVGVETNPGPAFALFLRQFPILSRLPTCRKLFPLYCKILGEFYTGYMILCALCTILIATIGHPFAVYFAFELYHFFTFNPAVAHCFQNELMWSLFNACLALRYYYRDPNMPMFQQNKAALDTLDMFSRTDDGFLVGVEPNPGPVLSTLVPQSGIASYIFGDVGKCVSETNENMSKISDNMTEKIAEVNANMSKITDIVDKALGNDGAFKVNHSFGSGFDISALWARIEKEIPGITKIGKYLAFVLLIVACERISKHWLNKESGLFLYAIACFLSFKFGQMFAKDFIHPLIDAYFRSQDLMSSKGSELKPQGGFSVVTVVELMVGVIYADAVKGCFTDRKKGVAAFMKTLGDMPKLSNGIVKFVDYILSITQKCINFFCEKFNLEKYVVKESMFPELQVITKDLYALIATFKGGASFNYDNAQRVFAIERRIVHALSEIPKSDEYASYRRSAFELLGVVKPLVKKFERNNVTGNGPRREPLGVLIGGPTGVGKSTTIIPLLLSVNAAVLPEEQLSAFEDNHNDMIWNYEGENPFADAYHGQFNTVLDEVGQVIDQAGAPDPTLLAIIRMVNIMAYPLHMADLEDKGNTNFNSEIVWGTTNRSIFHINSLHCGEAVTRRFLVAYVHVPKLEYCLPPPSDKPKIDLAVDIWERRLDVTKVKTDNETGFDMKIAEFHPWNFAKGRPEPGPILDFEQLTDLIVDRYEANKTSGEKLLKHQSMSKKDALDKRRAKELILLPQSSIDITGWDMSTPEGVRMAYASIPASHVQQASGFIDWCSLDEDDLHSWREFVCLDYMVAKNKIQNLPKSYYTERNWKWDVDRLCGKVSRKLDTWQTQILSFVTNHPYLVTLGAIVTAFALIWPMLGGALFPHSGDVRASKRLPGSRPKVAVRASLLKPPSQIVPQSGVNKNTIDLINKIVTKNMYHLTCEGRGMGYPMFVKGTVAIMPEHFNDSLQDWIERGVVDKNPVIKMRRISAPDAGFDIFYDAIVFGIVEEEEQDVTYADFGNACGSHTDIVKFYAADDEAVVKNRFDCVLVKPCLKDKFMIVADVAEPIGRQTYQGYSFEKGFSYKIATEKGECGCPLFASTPNGQPILVGMHVAGDGSSGRGTLVLKSNIEHIIKVFGFQVSVPVSTSEYVEAQVGTKMTPESMGRQVRLPQETSIRKSPLYGAWGNTGMAPCKLRPAYVDGELKDPMALARVKYSGAFKAFDEKLLGAVVNQTVSQIMLVSIDNCHWKPRVFTFEEAVAGIPGIDFVESVARSKSPGYPFVLDTKKSGKTAWFGSEGPYTFDSDECIALRSRLDTLISQLSEGIRCDFVFMDFLKDERKPLEKVLAFKSRLISAAPLDLNILMKMYFGDLVRWLMSNRIKNGMAIGINPFSHEWGVLVDHLLSVSKGNCIFGDFSGWDGSLSPRLMFTFLKLSEAYYAGCDLDHTIIRRVLFEEVVFSRHLTDVRGVGPVICEWFGSNPSGNNLTTCLNSWCNQIITNYSASLCVLEARGKQLDSLYMIDIIDVVESIPHHIRLITFGDDSGINVSDEWAPFVSQRTITAAMAQIGFKYTDENKGDDEHDHRPLVECSFLKRGFKKDTFGRWRAPLELRVIKDTPYWTKKNQLPGKVEEHVDNALKELAIHGKSIYDSLAPIIVEKSQQILRHSPNPVFEYNDAKALSSEYFY